MRDKPINVTEIIYETPEVGGLRQPLLAEAVRDGKKYLVSVSSRTQMTQQVFNAYVQQELGDDELPTITRKAFAYKVVALAPNRRTSNTQELGVRTYKGKTYLMKGGPSDSADALIINPNDPLQLERAQGKYMYVEGNDIRCHIKGRDFTITAAQIAADPDLSSLYTKIKTEQDKGPTRGYSSKFLANAAAELANNQIGVSRDSTGAITIKINQNGAIKSTVISENDMLDPQVQELCRSIENGQLPNITKLLYYTNKQSWTSQVSSNVEKIAIENYELSHGMKGREIAEALTRPSIESNRRELINLALANNLIHGALMDRVPPAGGLETVELDNVGKAKDYALAKIARGKEFIIPITMSAAGGGHTVYIAGVKEGNNYRTTILNQTEQVPPEALAELQNISRTVTTAINNDLRSSGSRVNISQSERSVVNAVFPSVGGGAGCQEVGVVLVDAIRSGNLQNVIANCGDLNLDSAKLAEVRLNATLAFEQVQLRTGLSMNQKISELTQREVTDAKSRLSIGLRLEPVEIRQQNNLTADRDDARKMLENRGEAITEARIVADAAVITETRKASILNDCLLGATIPSTPENLGYITAQARKNNLVLTAERVNAAPVAQRQQDLNVPIIQRPIANQERQERVVQQPNARMEAVQAPGLNVAAMQESIETSLSTAKEIFPGEIGEQLTFVRGAFQSQQPLVNGRMQDLSLAEASNLVAPIIKNQVLEFIAVRNSEDAKLLVRALDAAVAKQTFGEQAFNAISQRGALTELEKASIPDFKPIEHAASLAPRILAAAPIIQRPALDVRINAPVLNQERVIQQSVKRNTTAEEIFAGILSIKDLTISEKRAIIKDDIPDQKLRKSIAKELMTNAILTDNKEILLTIDPKDLNPVFAAQIQDMEPVELMSGVELSEERKQALLVALDGAVIVEQKPARIPNRQAEVPHVADDPRVEQEIKEGIINDAAETITKSLFGNDYAKRGNRLEDAESIKEIVALAVQDKALKDFQITNNEENIMSAYIRDNFTKKTPMGFLTGGIKLKTFTEEDKAVAVNDISRVIVKEVQRQKEPPIVLGNLHPNVVPYNVKAGGKSKG